MEIDSDIYTKGIRGNLSEEEINALSKEYDRFKPFFRHALEIMKKYCL